MMKNWQNSGFVAKFWTKCAFFTNEKWHFWRQIPMEPNDCTQLQR